MKKIVLICCIVVTCSSKASAFVLRNKGDMFLGVIGGYGFPQLGTMQDSSGKSVDYDKAKEYYFGFDFGYFLTNSFALSVEGNMKYKNIDYTFGEGESATISAFQSHFISLNMEAQYYWFEFFYLSGGFFINIPYGQASFNEKFKNPVQITGGMLVELGINMQFVRHFSLRIGMRSTLAFSPMLKASVNNYEAYSFPLDFVLSFQWDI